VNWEFENKEKVLEEEQKKKKEKETIRGMHTMHDCLQFAR
jgi:hypothetical protein